MEIKNKNKREKGESALKFYAKYSTLAAQMILIMVAGAFGGRALDSWMENGFPVFTLVLTILAVAGAVIYAVRGLFNDK